MVFRRKWSKGTHDFFHKLWKSRDASKAGVCLIPDIELTAEPNGLDIPWKHIVFGCIDFDAKAIERFSKQHKQNYK